MNAEKEEWPLSQPNTACPPITSAAAAAAAVSRSHPDSLAVIYFRYKSSSVCVRDFHLPAPDMEGTTANEAAGERNKAAP